MICLKKLAIISFVVVVVVKVEEDLLYFIYYRLFHKISTKLGIFSDKSPFSLRIFYQNL